MLLDALMQLKAHGRHAGVPPLLPRRRVRLGRDEHQRQERPRLHHQHRRRCKEPVVLRPLPGLPVIRDLIVDMTQFFKQYHSIKPYLDQRHDRRPRRSACSRPRSARSSTACTSASCARAARPACPSFWWNPDKFVGPAGLLQAYRFIADTPRPGDQRAPRQPRRSVPPVPLPHDHELRRRLPEGPEPDARRSARSRN